MEDPTAEPNELISKVDGAVMSLAEKQVKNSLRTAGDVVQEVLKAVENRRDGLSGCPTGFTDLDRLTNGLQPSDLIILAGRPGMGKSAFALTLASNSSINYGKKVAFFSLEMGAEQLMQRIICSMAGLELSKFRAGHLNRDEFAKLPGTASRIVQANSLYVDDNLDLEMPQFKTQSRFRLGHRRLFTADENGQRRKPRCRRRRHFAWFKSSRQRFENPSHRTRSAFA